MPVFVAFLRGINVGGNKKIEMARLKREFESWGYDNVVTILNSGNIVFSAKRGTPSSLEKAIAANIKKSFGIEVPTLVRSIESLEAIAEAGPFAKVSVTKDTRLYVTFLTEKPKAAKPKTDAGFSILRVTPTEIFSALDVSKAGTVDAMAVLEKTYGKGVTTRNWNTIERILRAARFSA